MDCFNNESKNIENQSTQITMRCRLCLNQNNCSKDIYTEYFWCDKREIYNNMLFETFNIIPHKGNKNIMKLICDFCVTKLRDALEFKKRILDCEQKLLNYIAVLDDSSVLSENNISIKIENLKDELEGEHHFDDTYQLDTQNDVFANNTHTVVNLEKLGISIKKVRMKSRTKLISKLADNVTQVQRIRSKPRNQPNMHSKSVMKKSDRVPRSVHNGIKWISMKPDNSSVKNAIKLLENSNITPFVWEVKRQYMCFCCSEHFADFQKLKEHTHDRHKFDEIKLVLRKSQDFELYKVDISSLNCKICSENCSDLVTLRMHLTEKHNILFCDAEDILIPFKVGDGNIFPCQKCYEKFHSFHLLNMHLNCHYLNHICNICGNSFKTSKNLEAHVKRHTKENMQKPNCKICNIVFDTSYKKRKHNVTVHKKDPSHRCPHCPERFMEFSHRLKHQLECHEGTIPFHKCERCDKSFYRKYLLTRHIKSDHLLEYNFKCDVCEYKFASKTKLKNHMVKHFGEKIHECGYCNKSFARSKTLKEHLKIHLNIKKWVCNVCGEAFVQNCSLKNHMKKHS